MSKMLTQSWSTLNGIIRHNLTIVFLLIGVLKVDIWGLKVSEESMMKIFETFKNRKYDTLSKSDTDTIMSYVMDSVRQGKHFHYMSKLRNAMDRESKRLEAVKGGSSNDWKIQAFRPAAYDDKSLSFTKCALCKKSWQTTQCNVTKVELLFPLEHGDSKIQIEKDGIFVEINGHTVNSSRGIMDISRAVIFDLSHILLEPNADRPDDALNITVKKQPCHNVFLKRCMLYEYCNINSTILDRFRAYSHKENKRPTDRVEAKLPQIKIIVHRSRPNSSRNSYHTDSVATTRHAYGNGRSQNVPSYRNTSSLREPRAITPTEILVENSKQPTEQQQPQKKKRQLANPISWDPAKRNDACGNRYDTALGCNRRPFEVNFGQHMNRWDILQPYSLDIGYCSGTCGHALLLSQINNELSAHAVFMNWVNGETPRVTCSPQRMSPVSVMMSDTDGRIETKILSNAKVETCMCT